MPPPPQYCADLLWFSQSSESAMGLLAATVALAVNVLVLTSGERIPIAGEVVQKDGLVLFRNVHGRLFSLSAEDVDFAATRDGIAAPPRKALAAAPPPVPLKRSGSAKRRAFAELEARYTPSGAAPRAGTATPMALTEDLPAKPADSQEEASWRARARSHQEAVRDARENRDRLASRAEALKDKIRSLLALGYDPSQFSHDTFELQDALSQLPSAEADITRAERAWAEFRDEARRSGVLPGWLR